MKWCTIAVCAAIFGFAVDETSARVGCLAGSKWTAACQECVCSEEGSAVCVQTTCEVSEKVSSDAGECAPNTTWSDECNFCHCSDGRLALCTKRQCINEADLPTIEIPHSSPPTIETELVSGHDCEPGTTWKNKCNVCLCTSDGYSSCTEIGCPEDSGPEYSCKPDSRWKDDCNKCFCNFDGVPLCTRIGCGDQGHKKPEINFDDDSKESSEALSSGSDVTAAALGGPSLKRVRRDDPPKPVVKACEPGEKFRVDCNTCLCHTDGGSFACTRNNCHETKQLEQSAGSSTGRRRREVGKQDVRDCEPGSVFDQDCNVCRCSSDGRHATCTLKRCQNILPEDKKKPAESESGFRCTPGEQFKRACNDCTCSADGKSVFCTIKLCEKEIVSQL